MPGHVRVCMLDGQFSSINLDESTPYPSGQKGAILPSGDLVCDGQAFAVAAEIQERLTGERTAPLWFLGCVPQTGTLYREHERDIWFIEVTKTRFLGETAQYVELTREEALAWLSANRYGNPYSKQIDPGPALVNDQATPPPPIPTRAEEGKQGPEALPPADPSIRESKFAPALREYAARLRESLDRLQRELDDALDSSRSNAIIRKMDEHRRQIGVIEWQLRQSGNVPGTAPEAPPMSADDLSGLPPLPASGWRPPTDIALWNLPIEIENVLKWRASEWAELERYCTDATPWGAEDKRASGRNRVRIPDPARAPVRRAGWRPVPCLLPAPRARPARPPDI